MGGRAGRPFQGADEIAEAPADTGGGQHLHQRAEEHRHHGGGGHGRHPRTAHAGYDARRAVHHRTAQLTSGTADGFLLFGAGREDKPGTHQRDPSHG